MNKQRTKKHRQTFNRHPQYVNDTSSLVLPCPLSTHYYYPMEICLIMYLLIYFSKFCKARMYIIIPTIPGKHWIKWKIIAKARPWALIPKSNQTDSDIITSYLPQNCHHFTFLGIIFLCKFTLQKQDPGDYFQYAIFGNFNATVFSGSA